MSTAPPDTETPADVFDHIANALEGYRTLFGAELTGRELARQAQALGRTDAYVTHHIELRLQYLQNLTLLGIAVDLSAMRELLTMVAKEQRRQRAQGNQAMEALEDMADEVHALRQIWDEPTPVQAELDDLPPEPGGGGNVSIASDADVENDTEVNDVE